MSTPDSAGSSTTATALVLLAGFVAVLATYLTLVLTGHNPSELVPTVVTLLGLAGITGHIERRTQQQNAVISKIDKQTNGVLDGRIKDGTTAAIQELIDTGKLAGPPARTTGRKPATARKRTAN